LDIDVNNLPPEIQEKLAQVMRMVDEREPEGEVSYDRLIALNNEVFGIRQKLLSAQLTGAEEATAHLIESMEKDSDVKNREKVLKMAIVSLEVTIDDSKQELVQALLKAKFEARKTGSRGSNGTGNDRDMIDAIIEAAEMEADYDPIAVQQKQEQSISKPKRNSGGFGFGTSSRV
tara:strand:+ start:241 stop:765 length:525 start_codon:yes stop_codon:yes gene_type:complete